MEEVTVKDAFDKFKPENCVFVISVDKEDNPSGMVAGWNMKCSMNPPMFAVSLSKRGHTHKLIQESKEFVVAVPNKELESAVVLFGTTHGDKVDKFRKVGMHIGEAKHVKSPLIMNATVNFECKLKKEIDSGDHIIFIGEIVAAYTNKEKKVLFNVRRNGDLRIFQELG